VVLDTGVDEGYEQCLRVEAFDQWRYCNNVPVQNDPSTLLRQFLDYLDDMFLAGGCHDDGNKTWLGLMHLIPALRDPFHLCLRVDQATTGWAKRAPASCRVAITEAVIMAIIGDQLARQKIFEAVNCLLQYLTGGRPGEIDGLSCRQLLPPPLAASGRLEDLEDVWGVLLYPQDLSTPGKTAASDEITLLDDPEWFFMGPHWQRLLMVRRSGQLHARKGEERLIPVEGTLVDLSFSESVKNLKLQDELFSPHLVRYGIRHASVSNDKLTNKRNRAQVYARCGWKPKISPAVMSHAVKVMNQIPAPVITYGQFVKANFAQILGNQVILPPFGKFQ
jgi:hypothetical protein